MQRKNKLKKSYYVKWYIPIWLSIGFGALFKMILFNKILHILLLPVSFPRHDIFNSCLY